MADTVHIGENSPQQVAYRLLHDIANVEKKTLHSNPGQGYTAADRKWILKTYSECLAAVENPLNLLD
jgi:hypothetical protein